MRSNHWSVVARIWQALRGLLLPIHYDSSSHGSLNVMLVVMCESIMPLACATKRMIEGVVDEEVCRRVVR